MLTSTAYTAAAATPRPSRMRATDQISSPVQGTDVTEAGGCVCDGRQCEALRQRGLRADCTAQHASSTRLHVRHDESGSKQCLAASPAA